MKLIIENLDGFKEYRKEKINPWITLAKIAGSLAVVVIGGRLTVNSGVDIARLFGISENFIGLTDPAKWALSFAMMLGRLEIFTLLILFTRAFWRR